MAGVGADLVAVQGLCSRCESTVVVVEHSVPVWNRDPWGDKAGAVRWWARPPGSYSMPAGGEVRSRAEAYRQSPKKAVELRCRCGRRPRVKLGELLDCATRAHVAGARSFTV